MNNDNLINMLKIEKCSDEFIEIALKHKDKYFGEILQFIEEIEKLYSEKKANYTSSCTSFENNGVNNGERNYNGNALDSHGYIYETDDGRKY